MKNFLTLASVCAIALASCNKDTVTPTGDFNAGLPSKPQKHLPVDVDGLITQNFLSKDTVWLIDGISFVRPGQTLEIQEGTYLTTGTLKPYTNGGATVNIGGVLVVPKTAKIDAEGTAAEPIVFTSPKATGRAAGDFGGLVLLGQAPTNRTTPPVIEGIPQPIGVDVTYGGNISADDSGILKYVRIEFAGFNLTPDNEINGLTLGGVGSGTVLSHIQVSWGRDDAFEFFGGTVNADHLVALSTDDDDFDFDFGYTGTIEYALSLKDPNSTNSTSGSSSDSNGLESDNDGTGSAASPKTQPTLKNFTFLGINNSTTAATKLKFGNRWRRASAMTITRSIIAGYGTGVSFESITAAGSTFSDNVVHGYTTAITGTPTPANYTGNSTSTAATANSYLLLGSPTANPFYQTAASGTTSYNPLILRPTASSPAYGNGTTTYKGAFQPGVAAWTQGWTQFSPKTY
ncbi:hypothetical protein FAZ19_12980 [Sphingobacterium alkalisoli]|uniref:T9SS C-terminal target domain-containing protein n=1 Tax=Sphingobacterium alkalisoli TaxID=1874115 RepID=A0A4U0H494_9SPHI|nr:hypothetical protein [Sphingobacterium alkalisoli]TJY66004.1 hypothetical protein FAZ19_12980 [Sphingobacterium alkalisoli]GGH16879.1 hypothetical protein GCM10011418_19480 [Sphingobacterium alkalisoli]